MRSKAHQLVFLWACRPGRNAQSGWLSDSHWCWKIVDRVLYRHLQDRCQAMPSEPCEAWRGERHSAKSSHPIATMVLAYKARRIVKYHALHHVEEEMHEFRGLSGRKA